MGRFLAGLMALFFGGLALGQPSTLECLAVKNQDFNSRWNEKVEPFFASGQRHVFLDRRHIPIVYRIFPSPRAAQSVVIFPGYAETSQKFKEVVYEFGCLGYSVYIFSHTGMGESGRSIHVASRQIVHIDDFSEYVADAEAFVARVRQIDKNPLYLFAHSTGGLIAAHMMAKQPSWIRAAVFSAPLFEVKLGQKPRWLVAGIMQAEILAGRGGNYAPGYGDFNPFNARFEDNIGTRNYPRWLRYNSFLRSSPMLWMGGPSNKWVLSMLEETTLPKLKTLARNSLTPLLVYQAGQDQYVAPGGQNYFCQYARHCRLQVFPRAFHEIWRDSDEDRVASLMEANAFFRAN